MPSYGTRKRASSGNVARSNGVAMSCRMNSKFGFSEQMVDIRFLREVEKLSTQMTRRPSSSRRSHRNDPMKPAPGHERGRHRALPITGPIPIPLSVRPSRRCRREDPLR